MNLNYQILIINKNHRIPNYLKITMNMISNFKVLFYIIKFEFQ